MEKARENYLTCWKCGERRPPRKMRSAGTVEVCKKHETASGGSWDDNIEEYITHGHLQQRQNTNLLRAQLDAVDSGKISVARKIYALRKQLNKGPIKSSRVTRLICMAYNMKIRETRPQTVEC